MDNGKIGVVEGVRGIGNTARQNFASKIHRSSAEVEDSAARRLALIGPIGQPFVNTSIHAQERGAIESLSFAAVIV